jgi:hypothetical protein
MGNAYYAVVGLLSRAHQFRPNNIIYGYDFSGVTIDGDIVFGNIIDKLAVLRFEIFDAVIVAEGYPFNIFHIGRSCRAVGLRYVYGCIIECNLVELAEFDSFCIAAFFNKYLLCHTWQGNNKKQ